MRFYPRKDIMPKVSRYSYPINKFEGIDAVNEESSMPLNLATYGYNIAMDKGVLTNSMGINIAKINNDYIPNTGTYGATIRKLFHYHRYDYELGAKDDRLVVLLSDSKLYQATLYDQIFYRTEMDMQSQNVAFLNYHYQGKDCLLAFSDAGKMYIYDGTTSQEITPSLKLGSACIHNERVYGTMNVGNNRLYFSAIQNPTNWNISLQEGGYISFPDAGGKVMKVISFKNSLYIFREYSIHRLTTFSEQSEYVLTKVYSTTSLIYANTVVICNNIIVFLTDDGLYRFDGNTCTKILREVTPIISDKTYSTACFYENKYYLATAIIRDDVVVGDEIKVLKNNGIIIADLDLNNISIFRGMDIREFIPFNLDYVSKLLMTFNHIYRGFVVGMADTSGTVFGFPLHKKWQSAYSDLNHLNKDKVLRRIFISTDSPITLKTKLDKEYSYDVYAKPQAQMIPINKKTDKIGIEITTDQNKFAIRGMILEFDVVKRSIYDGDY